ERAAWGSCGTTSASGDGSARDQRALAALAHHLAPGLDVTHERLRELGVELRPGAALDLADRDLVGQGAAIGAIRGHRVVRVGDRDDAPDDRDVVVGEPARIAAAVPPLVVAPAAVDQPVEARHRL